MCVLYRRCCCCRQQHAVSALSSRTFRQKVSPNCMRLGTFFPLSYVAALRTCFIFLISSPAAEGNVRRNACIVRALQRFLKLLRHNNSTALAARRHERRRACVWKCARCSVACAGTHKLCSRRHRVAENADAVNCTCTLLMERTLSGGVGVAATQRCIVSTSGTNL